MAIRQLLINRLVDRNKILRAMMVKFTIYSPVILGVMREEHKFSFILILRECFDISFQVQGHSNKCFEIFSYN